VSSNEEPSLEVSVALLGSAKGYIGWDAEIFLDIDFCVGKGEGGVGPMYQYSMEVLGLLGGRCLRTMQVVRSL
jgi:hypothetical protein